MANTHCDWCGKEIRVAIFKGEDHCSENCRKALAKELPCVYENVYTDEVGTISVCQVHGNNSKYSEEEGPHRPCLTLDPWSPQEAMTL